MRLSNFKTFHSSGKLRGFELVVLAGLMITAMTSYAKRAVAQSDEIRDETLRLHIIANSDSDADQALKLKIRDRILEGTGELFAEVSGKSDAVALTKISLNEIEALAKGLGSPFEISGAAHLAHTPDSCAYSLQGQAALLAPIGRHALPGAPTLERA